MDVPLIPLELIHLGSFQHGLSSFQTRLLSEVYTWVRCRQALPGKSESNGKGLRQSGSSGSVEFGLDTWMLPAETLQDVAAHSQLNDCHRTDPNEQRASEVRGGGALVCQPVPPLTLLCKRRSFMQEEAFLVVCVQASKCSS